MGPGGVAQYLIFNPGEVIDVEALGLDREFEKHLSVIRAMDASALKQVPDRTTDILIPKPSLVDGEMAYNEFDTALDAVEEKDELERERLRASSRRGSSARGGRARASV